MSARGITVSTVGLVPAMRQLAGEGLPVTLALSLHAPDDELRDTLVPVNTRWKVAEAHRRGVRVHPGHRPAGVHRVRADPRHQRPGLARRPARQAAQRARPGLGARQPDPAEPDARARSGRPRTRRWSGRSSPRSRPAASRRPIRDTRGSEIDGACGQLAATVRALSARQRLREPRPADGRLRRSRESGPARPGRSPLVAPRPARRRAASRHPCRRLRAGTLGRHRTTREAPMGTYAQAHAQSIADPAGLLGRGRERDHVERARRRIVLRRQRRAAVPLVPGRSAEHLLQRPGPPRRGRPR